MGFIVAIKAFFKAFTDPEGAQRFVTDQKNIEHKVIETPSADTNHIRILAALQQEGRLIDFLQEDIEAFDDAQIGAAVREVHRSCRDCLKNSVSLKPVLDEREGAEVRIPKGYDASRIKIVGNVSGEPPYVGKLVHKGWLAAKLKLPKQANNDAADIICPAEVEVP